MNHTSKKNTAPRIIGLSGIDTTFVLFFLAVEYGRAVQVFSIDGLLMGITMIMVLILPYFLPTQSERCEFGIWMLRRSAIAMAGIFLGFAFKQAVGSLKRGISFRCCFDHCWYGKCLRPVLWPYETPPG